jgi:hypothetical protein
MRPITLTVLGDGPTTSQTFAISKIPIGRTKTGNKFVLKDSAVSSKHGVLLWRDDHWAFCDLGSSNGSSVNGLSPKLEEGEERALADGDVVWLGPDSRMLVNVEVRDRCAMHAVAVPAPITDAMTPPPFPARTPPQAAEEELENMTVEEKLLADAQRVADNIKVRRCCGGRARAHGCSVRRPAGLPGSPASWSAGTLTASLADPLQGTAQLAADDMRRQWAERRAELAELLTAHAVPCNM